MVKTELIYGARHSQKVEANLRLLQLFFSPFASFAFDAHCAEEYGLIRSRLKSLGQPIGPNDFMIAAIASIHNTVLVTNNTSEFSRVAGLNVEDWANS